MAFLKTIVVFLNSFDVERKILNANGAVKDRMNEGMNERMDE